MYWSFTTMLTIGFGDLAAKNHYEALVLIFVEIFGVALLAYILNSLHSLLTEYR